MALSEAEECGGEVTQALSRMTPPEARTSLRRVLSSLAQLLVKDALTLMSLRNKCDAPGPGTGTAPTRASYPIRTPSNRPRPRRTPA